MPFHQQLSVLNKEIICQASPGERERNWEIAGHPEAKQFSGIK